MFPFLCKSVVDTSDFQMNHHPPGPATATAGGDGQSNYNGTRAETRQQIAVNMKRYQSDM